MVLTYADASIALGKTTADSDIVEGRFVDILPGVRIAHAVAFVADDPSYAGTMTMTWAVTATSEGTRVDIRADEVPGRNLRRRSRGRAGVLIGKPRGPRRTLIAVTKQRDPR